MSVVIQGLVKILDLTWLSSFLLEGINSLLKYNIVQDEYPRSHRNESPGGGGGDGEELQFGKSLPDSRGAEPQDPVQPVEQQTSGGDKLRPG